MSTRILIDGTVLIGPNIDIGANQKMNLATGRTLHQNLPYEKIPKTLEELQPYAVYATTDLYGSGQAVVRIRRASDDSERDMTGPELADTPYTTFISGTTGHVVKWYNQVVGSDTPASHTHLISETANEQPTLDENRSVQFGQTGFPDVLYSKDISVLSDRPDFDGDLTQASLMQDDSPAKGINFPFPLFSYYNGSSGGSAFSFVPAHGEDRRELLYDDGNFRTADQGSAAAKFADATIPAGGDANFHTAISKHISQTSRAILLDNSPTETNTEDCGTFVEAAVTRFGVGGYAIGSDGSVDAKGALTTAGSGVNVKASMIFDRELSDADIADLQRILAR